ncbi:MAG: hypothetical protein HUU10_07820 [Bacteroidetes bacterium]|nr:hypothetical protein [Bacteroidota bacterium]
MICRILSIAGLSLLLLSGFQCSPPSYTEKIHVYFNQDFSIRVLATVETNGYQPVWSEEAKAYINRYQTVQDSLMRRHWAVDVRKLDGQWDDKIRIYAVEGIFRNDYDFMNYLAPDNQLWDLILGRNDSIWRITFNLRAYRDELAKYAWAYQVVSREIIRSGKITFTAAGIDSFYLAKVQPAVKRESLELQTIAHRVTWGILSESERIVMPFNQTLFSLQKYRFHVGGMAYDISSPYLRQDVDGSLVYFPYPEYSDNVLKYAIYSPFRPDFGLERIREAVYEEVPEIISFKWRRYKPGSGLGDADRVRIIPVGEPVAQ